jgi:cardiolipin synthase
MTRISNYNLANLLTFSRVLMVPIFIGLMLYGHMGWALAVFVLASVTDYFDGLVARRFKLATELGAWLDPAADKLLTLSAFILLSMAQHVPLWMTITVLTRDLLVVAGALAVAFVMNQHQIKPTGWGKVATFGQMIGLAAILGAQWLGWWEDWGDGLVWGLGVMVIATSLSGLDYLVRGILRYGTVMEEHRQDPN